MRVLLDTSVLISFLRSTKPSSSATAAILEAALTGAITLLSVNAVFEELSRKVDQRPDLAARITRSNLEALVHELRALGEPMERVSEPYAEVGRDRDDFFLIAHAVIAEADYLVSWDKDLLVLDPIDDLRVVTPPQLLAILRDLDLARC